MRRSSSEDWIQRAKLKVAFLVKLTKMRRPNLRLRLRRQPPNFVKKWLQKTQGSIECASTSERPSEEFFNKLIKQCVWVLELEVDTIFRQATCINLFSSFAIV